MILRCNTCACGTESPLALWNSVLECLKSKMRPYIYVLRTKKNCLFFLLALEHKGKREGRTQREEKGNKQDMMVSCVFCTVFLWSSARAWCSVFFLEFRQRLDAQFFMKFRQGYKVHSRDCINFISFLSLSQARFKGLLQVFASISSSGGAGINAFLKHNLVDHHLLCLRLILWRMSH